MRLIPFSPLADFPWSDSLHRAMEDGPGSKAPMRSGAADSLLPLQDHRALFLHPYAGEQILWYHSLIFADRIVYPEIFSPHPFQEGALSLPHTSSDYLWEQEFFHPQGPRPDLHQWALLGVPLSYSEAEVLEGVKPLQNLLPREEAPPWLGVLERWVMELEGRLRLSLAMKLEARAAARAYLIRGGKALPGIPPGAGSKAANKALFQKIMGNIHVY